MNAQEPTIMEQPVQPEVEKTPVVEEPTTTKEVQNGSPLECNICYEESDEPVTTHCGHIYCWSCVYKWTDLKGSRAECPVCKNTITKEKLIPLYPKNYSQEKINSENTDGVPKRPLAAREQTNGTHNRGFGLFTGINIQSRGFGMTIGCLPTFIPIIMMLIINLFAFFLDNDDDTDYTSLDASDSDLVNNRYAFSADQYAEPYESDVFDYTVIIIMIIFVALPFILKRFSRRN